MPTPKKCSCCGYTGNGWIYLNVQHFVTFSAHAYDCPECLSTNCVRIKKGKD